MSAIQGWFLLLLLAGLAARSFDGLRLALDALRYVAALAVVAVVQRVFEDQVTLDEPFFGPLLIAIPIVAAVRGGMRVGLSTAFAGWLLLVVVGGAVPTGASDDMRQETLQLATCFAVVLSGVAASLATERRMAAALVPLGWWLFFAARDPRLLMSPAVIAVPVVAVGWTCLGLAAPEEVSVEVGETAPRV